MTRNGVPGSGASESDFDLVCRLENVQGLVDALTTIKWKRQQDAICELSEHGLIIVAEELNCLHAKVYFRKDLFREYHYRADVRLRFGVSLGVLVDCLNTFAQAAAAATLELRYPGRDMQLLLRLIDFNQTCIDAELRTRIPDGIPRDFVLDDDSAERPVSFAIRSAALKEVLEDLEWPGASVQLSMQPEPPQVSFRAEGHGDLQIDLLFERQRDLFIDFNCDRPVTFCAHAGGKLPAVNGWLARQLSPFALQLQPRLPPACKSYKYKYLRATTANIPGSIVKDNRGSKLTVDAQGLLRVQHIISLRSSGQAQHLHHEPGEAQDHSSRTSYVEFFLLPEEPAEDNYVYDEGI